MSSRNPMNRFVMSSSVRQYKRNSCQTNEADDPGASLPEILVLIEKEVGDEITERLVVLPIFGHKCLYNVTI